jgi:hypothetical protein
MLIFGLYFVWDWLGIWMVSVRIREGDTFVPKYPKIEEEKMTGEPQQRNWVGTAVTGVFLATFIVLWLFADNNTLSPAESTWLLVMATIALFLYRFAKEVRSSWD